MRDFQSKFIKLAFSGLAYSVIIIPSVYIVGNISYQIVRSFEDCRIGCSVARILANPWIYNNRKITIVGFIVLKRDENVIYTSEESADYTFEGLWLDKIPERFIKNRERYNYQHVKITGRFSSWSHGYGRLFPGAIHDIEEIKVMRSKKRY